MGERSMIMRKIMRVVVKNNEFSRDQGKGLREEGVGYRGRKGEIQREEREGQRRRLGMRKNRKRDKEHGGLNHSRSL